jgi:type II secretory pathway component PulF
LNDLDLALSIAKPMPLFAYQAIDPLGKDTSGTIEAADRASAQRLLTGKGLQPFKVAEASAAQSGKTAKTAAPQKPGAASKVVLPTGPISLSNAQVQLFTEELSELLEAGMRLEPALKLMEGKGDVVSAPYRQVAKRIGDLVREGHPFNSAVRTASPSFGELFCSVAAAGEAGGSLGSAMRRQAIYQAASSEMRSRVAVALIYPSFLVVAGIGVTVLFAVYLIPTLLKLINNSRGGKPPALAIFLMQSTEFLKGNWIFIVMGIAAVIIAIILTLRSKAGRYQWDRLKLKLPFIGGVLSAGLHSQFLETLASLSVGGLPLLRGLDLASRVTNNVHAQAQLIKSIDVVRDGGNLSRALERTALFPTNMIEMVRLGEHTGDLPAALRRAADRCGRELGRNLEKAAAAIQPLIILVMAGVVGIMAYLMISIIYETINTINRKGKTQSFNHPQPAIIKHYEYLA